MSSTRLNLKAHDGHAIVAYRYEPNRPPSAGIVIATAMAVAQSYYADFAAYLASQGHRVWTFDYRGMGESRNGSMRGCKADISDWVTKDFDSVVQHASDQMQDLPLFVIGHSLGGQTTPLLPSVKRISGLINVAVGSGTMRHNQPKVRRNAPFLWYFLAPVLSPLFGYYPGSLVGVIGDVPTRAMFQWRRWCLTPEYLLSGEPGAREAYAQASYPVLALTIGDDELLLESGSRMLHDAYVNTEVDYRVLEPQELTLRRIGHFGFFKSSVGAALWPMVCDWVAHHCQETNNSLPS